MSSNVFTCIYLIHLKKNRLAICWYISCQTNKAVTVNSFTVIRLYSNWVPATKKVRHLKRHLWNKRWVYSSKTKVAWQLCEVGINCQTFLLKTVQLEIQFPAIFPFYCSDRLCCPYPYFHCVQKDSLWKIAPIAW